MTLVGWSLYRLSCCISFFSRDGHTRALSRRPNDATDQACFCWKRGNTSASATVGDDPSLRLRLQNLTVTNADREDKMRQCQTILISRRRSNLTKFSYSRALNKLPSHLRLMQSADTFRLILKHFYFTRLFYHDIVKGKGKCIYIARFL